MNKKSYLPFFSIAVGIILIAGALLFLWQYSGQEESDDAQRNERVSETPVASAESVPSNPDAQEEGEVLLNEADAQQESGIRTELAKVLPFVEGDDKACAIAYMGEGAQNQENNLISLCRQYMPDTYQELIASLPVIDYGGAECYLIIPRYQDMIVSLNCLEMNDDGNIEVGRTDMVKNGAFLLYCNPSALYSNAEVYINYGEQTFVLMPRLSTLDGHLEPMQVAMDVTQEQAYQPEAVQ